jgi:predicted secreted protein
MANAISAFGTQLKRSGTLVAEINDISGPSLSRDTIEVTHHQSTNRWREFIKSLKDGGEISFTINYNPVDTTHKTSTGVLADFANDTTVDTWSLVFPDSGLTTWSFPAIVTGFEPKEPIDDRLTADITLKVAGQPTLV